MQHNNVNFILIKDLQNEPMHIRSMIVNGNRSGNLFNSLRNSRKTLTGKSYGESCTLLRGWKMSYVKNE